MTDHSRIDLINQKRREAMAEKHRYESWAMQKDRTGGYTNWGDATESVRMFTEIVTCNDLDELDRIIEDLKKRSMPYFAKKMAENLG